jgi:hypothetical protein
MFSAEELQPEIPLNTQPSTVQQTGINPTAINPNNFTQPANNNYNNLSSLEKDRLLFNNR